MPRSKGASNRNFPKLMLDQAIKVPEAIQNGASGESVSRLTLAELMDLSPGSGHFRDLLLASRAYGLTEGGANADLFSLTSLGVEITSSDELRIQSAKRRAVMAVEPFEAALTNYNGKRVPNLSAFREWIVQNTSVREDRAEECIEHLLEDARVVGLVRVAKGGSEYFDLDSGERQAGSSAGMNDKGIGENGSGDESSLDHLTMNDSCSPRSLSSTSVVSERPKKLFIGHGKERGPLEEVKKVLQQFGVPIAVAVDEPHAGRPISAKVAQLMRDECSSAVFIFTADEKFLQEDENGETQEVWRPSENVIYELGAASILYGRRIVILKEERVTFPSDFSDLGYLEFEEDQVSTQTANLFSELFALDIIEVRAKA